jgi:flavin reductase (DIM6/NTAB) family NADH-FMN oxidoreductase RutF/DNA-binding MarR family transcriptional regulator
VGKADSVLPVEAGDPRLDAPSFRRTLGQFGTGVTVVTTAVGDALFGVTSNSFASVSLDPPLVLWSIRKESTSYEAFTSGKAFVINVLATDQTDLSSKFAKSGDDKFEGVSWEKGSNGSPVLHGAVASFECETRHLYEGGDHTIIVGEVTRFSRYEREALLFSQGRYAQADAAALQYMRAIASAATDEAAQNARMLTPMLRNAYGALWNRMAETRRNVGMSSPQIAILRTIRNHPGLRPEEVAARLGFGLNASEDELEQLIGRGALATADGGKLTLTETGQEALDVFFAAADEMEDAVTAQFSKSDINTLLRVLEGISARQD